MSAPKIDKKLQIKKIDICDGHGKMGHNSNVYILACEAHNQLSMSERHVTPSYFDVLKSSNYDEIDNGLFVHLVLYGDNESVAIVPKSHEGLDKQDLDLQAPPEDGDFLKKESFIYFFNDYAIMLSNGITPPQIRDYLTALFRKSELINKDQSVVLNDLADNDAVQRIREHGVKQIKMKSLIDPGGWYGSKPEGKGMPFISKVTSYMTDLICQDNEITDEAAHKYEYELIINHKGALEAIERDPLQRPAIELFEDSEDDMEYEIILNDGGGSIKAGAIKLDTKISVSRLGSSLDTERIKKECVEYKKRLVKRGIILNAV